MSINSESFRVLSVESFCLTFFVLHWNRLFSDCSGSKIQDAFLLPEVPHQTWIIISILKVKSFIFHDINKFNDMINIPTFVR